MINTVRHEDNHIDRNPNKRFYIQGHSRVKYSIRHTYRFA